MALWEVVALAVVDGAPHPHPPPVQVHCCGPRGPRSQRDDEREAAEAHPAAPEHHSCPLCLPGHGPGLPLLLHPCLPVHFCRAERWACQWVLVPLLLI